MSPRYQFARRSVRPKPVALLCALIGFCTLTQAQTQAWTSTLTRPARVQTLADAGPKAASEPIDVAVALRLRHKDRLDALTRDIMAGRRPPITHAQFMREFAPSQDDVRRVESHLRASGLVGIKASPNRMLVNATGNSQSVAVAFNTHLHTYAMKDRLAFANVDDAQVPGELQGIVSAILGLQTVHRAHTTMHLFNPKGMRRMDVTGVDPTQFQSIYGAAGLPVATNANIGIITQGDMTQTLADLSTFASNAGYPAPNVSVAQVGTASNDTSGVGEWNMDTQASLAAAGGAVAQMVLYTASTLSDADLTNTYNRVVSDDAVQTINVSLGECENDAASSGVESSNDAIFQSAVAQGQTFSVASGDSGSYECGGSTSYQSYPAVSPYVIAVGGTTLSSSNGSWQGETAWSCAGASDCSRDASGGGGGGVSATEAAPAWQTASGVLGGSSQRGVPDIAFDAAPSSGALILVNGSSQQIGGTSLAAPLFTGFFARIQSANGNAVPFPAATLYQGAASNPFWFNDVTQGSNGGYSAAQGWDYVTGFGSLVVGNFATAFQNR